MDTEIVNFYSLRDNGYFDINKLSYEWKNNKHYRIEDKNKIIQINAVINEEKESEQVKEWIQIWEAELVSDFVNKKIIKLFSNEKPPKKYKLICHGFTEGNKFVMAMQDEFKFLSLDITIEFV